MLRSIPPFKYEPLGNLQKLAIELVPLKPNRSEIMIRQGEDCENAYFVPQTKGQPQACWMRVLREVTLAAGERGRGARERRRLLEIGNIYSPGFFGTPYTPGNKVVADATYIRSDLVGGGVDGTMYSIPWTLLYTCVSIKCIEAANALVGEVTINYYHI